MLSGGTQASQMPQQLQSRGSSQRLLILFRTTSQSLAASWPLWLCLALALAVRLFLAIRHNPVIEGDEALTGIQAENILRGEWPIYYYGQPYMGSLEAYIIALFFAIAGPSVLVLRIAMTCTSLLLVWLTWGCGEALADEAGLRAGPRRLFVTVATAIAALPPLYDTVLELRSYGGYTEAMIVMLWLLWATLRLTQRWRQGASRHELAWRWAGIGLLIGLGLWIDPLIVYALATMTLWLAAFLWQSRPRQPGKGEKHQPASEPQTRLKEGLLAAPVALPSLLLGLGPALIYGAQHNWANVLYMLQGGHPISAPGSRLHVLREVVTFYVRCVAPRVIGGTLPTEPYVTQNHPAVLTPGLVINGLAMALAVIALLLSRIWPRPTLLCLRRLTLLPILFALCLTVIYCLDPLAVASVYSGCGPWDLTGRYVVPLVIVLPFFLASAVTLCWYGSAAIENKPSSVSLAPPPSEPQAEPPAPRPVSEQRPIWQSLLRPALLLLLLACYFSTQFSAYAVANTHNTFETSGCVKAPGDYTPIITYLRQQQISYALATAWVGNPITFITNQQILVTEPRARLPEYSQRVLHAAHYALLLFVRQNNSQPAIVEALQQKHWRYTLKRFPTVPGWELMVVITPDHNVSPTDPAFRQALRQLYNLCEE
uniref:Glycosyltransferase RgtA/B/C/D-like domain-containing protein n=1 Tax=Thermogemmatispora argillosa TaxID=2045280 RepID=A0A455SXL1_9CHLR|nr:hypothetical protein KTA_13620 [Thermogemmatispora argillosa]